MKVFLDTNIILDVLLERAPFARSAKLLLLLAAVGEMDACCGASQLTDVYYLLRRHDTTVPCERTVKQLKAFREQIQICSLTEDDVDRALDSGWKDFEDACIYSMADRVGADYLITRDRDDFEGSLIKVVDCDGFFNDLADQGIVYEEIELEG